MKKTKISVFITLITLVASLTFGTTSASAVFSGGDGQSVDTAWQISSCTDLVAINGSTDYSDDFFIVTADFSCATNGVLQPIAASMGGNFSGEFNGNGKTISDITIDPAFGEGAGMFYQLQNANIKDLTLDNISVESSLSYVGLLSGNSVGTYIQNVNLEGSITTTGDLNICGYVGGVAGSANSSTVETATINVTVNGGNCSLVGGVFGSVYAGGIEKVKVSGSVSGNDEIGGIVGYGDTQISETVNLSDVVGEDQVGGFFGYSSDADVENSYNRGEINGATQIGGIMGYRDCGDIDTSYSTGIVTGTVDTPGGITGYDDCGHTYDTFWDMETSGVENTDDNATGKYTNQMKDVATFTDAGNIDGLDNAWDFVDNPNLDSGTDDYWGIDPTINDGYPYLRNLNYDTPDDNENIDDLDGVTAEVENAGPNSGDANGDGVLDSGQAIVSSFVNPISNKYVVVQSGPECRVATPSAAKEDTNSKDIGFDYPNGLVNFTFAQCSGSSSQVTLYFYGVTSDKFVVRKLKGNAYSTIDGASLKIVTIGGQSVAKVSYTLVDNGPLDSDPALFNMVDPAGLGSLVIAAPRTGFGGVGSLPATGSNAISTLWLALSVLAVGTLLFSFLILFSKKRKQLA